MRRYAIGVAVLAFAATSLIWAQTKAEQPAVVRKMLMQQDLSAPEGYVLLLVSVEIPVGGREGRHKHPGALAAYVQQGVVSLDYEGKPTVTYKAGETFFVEAGKVHEGVNLGSEPVRLLASFVSPKGQPLTAQVQ